MPGAQERVLRRKIGSFQNMKKITRAMELIAATRVVKAVQAANESRPYSEHITQVITDLAAAGAGAGHPLLAQPETVRTVGIVVLSSDRGLAGAYNSSVIRAAEREILAAKDAGRDYLLVTVGKKAEAYFRFRGYQVDASYTGFTEKPSYEDAREIAAEVTSMFGDRAEEILLAYTRFISMGTQEVVVRRFLPLETDALPSDGSSETASGPSAEFEFEPSPSAVLAALLPRYVESRLFAALLDAAASELSARQRAMKSATDNAQDLITKLSRKMNQARQEAITTEIMEIVGGAEALAADRGDGEDLLLDHLDSDPFPALLRERQFAHARHLQADR
jgi:F-type H+-transporting ATPase subunit gamma